MDPSSAQRVIEDLRKGLPPDGHVCHFTVGRESEINTLYNRLERSTTGALLLKANYGSGKSHLLRFIKEKALQEGYLVSSVSLDARSAVRFNRMDQIMGAILRNLEVPTKLRQKGIRPFFDMVSGIIGSKKGQDNASFWKRLTNGWRWDLSSATESPALFVALRAWSTGNSSVHDLIEDWLLQSWNYKSQRKRLYIDLVAELRNHFRDPRPDWKFYNDGIFEFHTQGYAQSWALLRDIHNLSIAAGLKGLIILFDEFEDVIHNMNNIKHQETAFWNLFEFYFAKEYHGMTYFAVTPDFAKKCKRLLIEKRRWDYDFTIFDALPTFEMSPLKESELQELGLKILEVHGIAYDWEPDTIMKMHELKAIVAKAASVQVQDRARQTIKEIVRHLDMLFEDME